MDTTDAPNEDTSNTSNASNAPNAPKKLKRALKKLEAEGEEPVFIFPAILERYATDRMLAMVRMGMMDRIFGYLVVTRKNVHFIRPAMLWDQVRTVPLEKIDDVEYIKEFHSNTLELKAMNGTEKIIFYEETDGIKFYQYIKQWLKERKSQS
ncbi:MAG: hypothetical protein WB392_10820 [Methanotrichaceae archaeon]